MGLHIERMNDVAVIVPSGSLTGGKETDELETNLRKLVHDNQKKILLDLNKTTYMSSIAIGVLASVQASAINRNLEFYVCNVRDRVENVLTIVKLIRILTVFETREEALAELGKL